MGDDAAGLTRDARAEQAVGAAEVEHRLAAHVRDGEGGHGVVDRGPDATRAPCLEMFWSVEPHARFFPFSMGYQALEYSHEEMFLAWKTLS